VLRGHHLYRRDRCPRGQLAAFDLAADQVGQLLVQRLGRAPVQLHAS
jgi:hypothetical protein